MMRVTDARTKAASDRSSPRLAPATIEKAIVSLHDPAAIDPAVTGSKAAALAQAVRAGLPVLDGFVVTTPLSEAIYAAGSIENLPAGDLEDLHASWKVLSHGGRLPLVVRSSSTAEDGDDSSMAGMFSSFLDIRTWPQFVEAAEAVLHSRKTIDLQQGTVTEAPIAVLVQLQLNAQRGGVLFGVDPITGDPGKLAVVAVQGGPDALVSGSVDGAQILLNRNGRALSGDGSLLTKRDRKSLAQLAAATERHFGGPQDMEWGIDAAGELHLFQSRPITVAGSRPSGPILGPGPIAESFPNELAALELDLWIDPLRTAIRHALGLVGAASRRRLRSSPIVSVVKGRVAVDLELFGIAPVTRGFIAKLDPRPPARRMISAWRVGRIKAALPALAGATIAKVDANLDRVPPLAELSDPQLITVLERTRDTLVSLHGLEVLAGLLSHEDGPGATGAALGLRSLALARSEGFSTEQTIKDHPEVLTLLPPAIGATPELPATTSMTLECDSPDRELGPREALRLRIRWVQELAARVAWEAGLRMQGLRRIPSTEAIALLTLEELTSLLRGEGEPADLSTRNRPSSAPLPAAFRLTDEGIPVPVAIGEADGRGAGGGRGMGRVHQGRTPAHGDVLVVQNLDPALASLLPTIGGLIAETGSVLSHLAILAREFNVPTVVGANGALERYPEGTVVIVDGTTGAVEKVDG